MSERATVDVFAVAPRTPGEVRFHITGGVLNGTATLSGLVWVLATWREHAPAWPWVLLAILAGIYVADLVSGLLHWAFDTWFDEDIAFLRRMVLQVREHHVYPNRIFYISFLRDAGTLSWIALILTVFLQAPEGRQQTRALPNLLPPLWGLKIFSSPDPGPPLLRRSDPGLHAMGPSGAFLTTFGSHLR